MPGRANELIVIPDSFWQRSETAAALRDRDIGRFFALIQQHTGASQTQIGMACGGMTQGKISDIMRGVQEVKHLDKFDVIADGLKMPDAARVILGLAPKAVPHPTSQNSRRPVVLGETNTALQSSYASGLLNLDSGDEQEDDDDLRRRVFVGLTGAAMLNAMFGDTARMPRLSMRSRSHPSLPGKLPASLASRPTGCRISARSRLLSTTRAASTRNAITRS
jgi:hypothetical protein